MSETPSHVLEGSIIEPAHHAASVAVAASTETVSSEETLQIKISEYFDSHIVPPYVVRTEEAARDLQQHKDVFINAAIEVFGSRAADVSEDYNPRLKELASILASVDHNAGIYYKKDDVGGIFKTIAHEIFDDPETQRQLASEVAQPRAVIQARAAEVASVDREVSLPLVKDESGGWRIVGNQEYGSTVDFKPLEVLRQDSADKSGYAKYRFRRPTYTRTSNAKHTEQVAEGWYTSEWYQDPNYWSGKIRDALVSTVTNANRQMADIGASVVFITEGGVFKGTATEGTDVDTSCWVVCKTTDDFSAAYAAVSGQLANCFDAIPFGTKRGRGEITPSFLDRSTGQQYYRDDSGEFKVSEDTDVVDGNFIVRIRKHEKGLMITAADGVALFRKPKLQDNKDDLYVSITPTGTVR